MSHLPQESSRKKHDIGPKYCKVCTTVFMNWRLDQICLSSNSLCKMCLNPRKNYTNKTWNWTEIMFCKYAVMTCDQHDHTKTWIWAEMDFCKMTKYRLHRLHLLHLPYWLCLGSVGLVGASHRLHLLHLPYWQPLQTPLNMISTKTKHGFGPISTSGKYAHPQQ